MNYGEKVKHVRKRNGKSAAELATYLNVSPQMVYQVERGISKFSNDNTLKMAGYFDLPVDFFLNDNYVSLADFEVNDNTKRILTDSNLVNYIVLADKAKKENISIAELEEAINFIINIKKSRN